MLQLRFCNRWKHCFFLLLKGDMADYTLQFKNSFDTLAQEGDSTKFNCKVPGNIAGLDHVFYHSYLRSIPHNKKIEIPITFSETDLCTEYHDIVLQITATCERPSTRSQVYQYGLKFNGVTQLEELDYSVHREAESSAYTIQEISWKSFPPNLVTPPAATTATQDCNCATNSGSGGEGYYSGYGGGLGGGATDGGNGGGIAITNIETSPSSVCLFSFTTDFNLLYTVICTFGFTVRNQVREWVLARSPRKSFCNSYRCEESFSVGRESGLKQHQIGDKISDLFIYHI